MKQSKSFGQVFLKDPNYIKKILDSLKIEGETILEIGPGDGRVSELIKDKAAFLYCVEVDARFYGLLRKKFRNHKNIEIIHKDILKFSFPELNEKIVVFGNVPYQISNQLIKYFVDNRAFIKRAYFTFQKEFVDKLTAKPSTKSYGFLSCYIQFYAKVDKLFDIPATAFTPVPRVDSSFMKVEFYSSNPYQNQTYDIDFLFKVIRTAFSNRRKKIINSLPLPKSEKNEFFLSMKIPPDLRPENISLEDYIVLSNQIYKKYGKF